MATNFDLNRGMENKKTSVFIISLITFIVLFFATIITIQMCNGKHVKTPVLEINNNERIADSVKYIDTTIINNKTEINIKENKGDINIGK